MSHELKPCPFCAGAPKVIIESGDERVGYANTVKVQCSSCGATIMASGDTSKPGYADNSTTGTRARAKWNRRAAPADLDAEGLPALAKTPYLIEHYHDDGGVTCEEGYTADQVRQAQRDAVAADRRAGRIHDGRPEV